MRVHEMDGEDKQDGEQPFFAVDHQYRIQRPSREEVRKERREPHRVARETDDHHSPEHRPVIELLPVGIALELGFWPQSEELAEVPEQVLDILPVGHHRGRTPEDALLAIHDAAGEDLLHVQQQTRS